MNNHIESWNVEPNAAKIRLDQYLVGRIPGESRSQIQNWIRKGYLRINGAQVKTGYWTKPGDRIELHLPDALPDQPFPEEIPLDILYEDSDVAVINKPAGLVCHTGAGIRSGTLVNALLHHMGPLQTGDPARPGIVHRLDKMTSGVMLIAKNKFAHRQLSQQFKSREVKKEYTALVHGCPFPASGTIDMALGRDPQNRKKISVRARRKRSAITHFTVERSFGSVSLLAIRIETGRTHQIRVHLAQKGHPIVGDSVYGPNRTRSLPPKLQAAAKELQRPFLHSRLLEFHHPRSGEAMAFRAPLSPELLRFLAVLER
ncbi:MAG TPA: RluA family pseudouridine synthase [Acidobacteriota bacterium]|nr:RluA family pseudouridine synthase [Acidobacteriota bacterium]